ncbi:MAG: DNA topoisomerase 4 subunit A [Clostridia bacterium]|nr:DNA topoisomerase 4 subunit A [Clostridia bacterium]
MPKKVEKPIVKDDPSRILPTTMEDVMHQSMIPYAEHVILDRAIPRVEDGLKPVQRRILYTMMELGTTPDKPHRKCARIVGDCLGKYHPHGDSSVYDALVRMAQPFVMRGPMVDGHGNFGSIDGDSAAAMRYTEARMAPLALLMLRDIEKDTVPFRLNFDDSLKEPDMLPARFPNLLVNGASGIAVGLATNIPPHNLREATRACMAQIENPDITLDELMQIIPGPDFPTGGILVRNEEIRLGYETGRSKLSVRARVQIEEGSAGRKLLVITEVPYQVNKAQMLTKIQQLKEEKPNLFGCIYDIRDESDREGMRAVIELRKDASVDKTLAYLYKYSDLQVTFGVNMVAIADGKPVQMGLKSMIGYFIRHQKNVVTRRTTYNLNQARARAHILEGLMIAVDNLDEVIRLIRASKNPKEARSALMEAFALDEIQAQAILDMRLQRLTNLEILALRKEFEELQKLIRRLEGILASEKKLMKVIYDELQEIAEEYGDDRRTSIEDDNSTPIEAGDIQPPAEDVVIAFTRSGQLKRMQPALYRKTPLPSPKDDPRESADYLFQAKSTDTLYIFTDLGNCFTLRVNTLKECKPKERGQQLAGILPGLADNEKPLYMICCDSADMAHQDDLLFVTARGQVKRSQAVDYAVRSRKFAATTIKAEDRLVCILQAHSDQDLLLVSRMGMAARFSLDSVSVVGRTGSGVRGIMLDPKDEVAFAMQILPHSQLIFFTERGYGKRFPEVNLTQKNRGVKGSRLLPSSQTAATGRQVVAAVQCDDLTHEIMITQTKSAPTILPCKEIAIEEVSHRGFPHVMALLDDLVTGAEIL